VFGHIASKELHSVPQSAVRPATTTAPGGLQAQVPLRTDTVTGVPSCGSAEVICPSRPAIIGRPSASMAHIAYTAGSLSSATRCGVGMPENG
jgi:hypothetical protein